MCNLVKLPKIHLTERTEEHARYFELDGSIIVAVLSFFKEKVAILVGEYLDAAKELFSLPDFIGWGWHYEACIDYVVGVLQLVNAFDRIDFLFFVQIEDHAMWSHRDLQQIV